jgi:hypothetical protein
MTPFLAFAALTTACAIALAAARRRHQRSCPCAWANDTHQPRKGEG